jgi:TatD DNase family protein
VPYINVHTHKNSSNKYTIRNLFPEETDQIIDSGIYSVGLHPWEVQHSDIQKSLDAVKKAAQLPNVIAVGEFGLDKYRDAFDLQYEVFLKQIEIAIKVEKPIVIHCVKAYSELLEIVKEKQLEIPVIIHRYSGNRTIADQLIKFGCYLSFGHELFHEKSKVPRVFKTLPEDHILLETDDSDLTIETVYQKAAELRNIELPELQKRIIANFETCFKMNVDS